MSGSGMSFLGFKKGSFRKPSLKQSQSIGIANPQEPQRSSSRVFQPNAEEMKPVFDKFDANKDGKICLEEYKLAVRALGGANAAENDAAKEFRVLDSDGDGFIDFREFMEVHNAGGGTKANDLQSAFRSFDLDGNGKISAEELLQVLRKLGESCSLKSCRTMVSGVDKDGDGLIDMDEFMGMMTRTLKLSCK